MVEEQTKVSEEELAKIKQDLQSANTNIVSAEVQKQIDDAKAQAKVEAEKEFATNQKIKELEEEKAKLKAEQEAKEKDAAEQLAKLTEKVNDLTSSKAPAKSDSPFESTNETPNSGFKPTEEDADEIEKASMEVFLKERQVHFIRWF